MCHETSGVNHNPSNHHRQHGEDLPGTKWLIQCFSHRVWLSISKNKISCYYKLVMSPMLSVILFSGNSSTSSKRMTLGVLVKVVR